MGIKITGGFKTLQLTVKKAEVIKPFVEYNLKYTKEDWWTIRSGSLINNSNTMLGSSIPQFSNIVLPSGGLVLATEQHTGSQISNFTSQIQGA